MLLTSGELDRRVRLERRDENTRDSTGHPVVTWTLVQEVWAKKKPLFGRELVAAQQITPTVQAEYWIRWRTDVTAKWRLVDGANNFDITYVGELGRREGLRLLVQLPEGT